MEFDFAGPADLNEHKHYGDDEACSMMAHPAARRFGCLSYAAVFGGDGWDEEDVA